MLAGPSVDSVADESVTPLVRKAAAWAWRLLVILAAVVALLWAFKRLELIFVPVALATILAALAAAPSRLPRLAAARRAAAPWRWSY